MSLQVDRAAADPGRIVEWFEQAASSGDLAGTFARAYNDNRRVAIDDAIEADPVAACVRELMADCSTWAGSAADLLRVGADRSRKAAIVAGRDWPKNPRAFAGRLRRAQTFLRALGIEVAFNREGHAGSRIIRIHASPRYAVSVGNGPNFFEP
jgi:hypothetical protein